MIKKCGEFYSNKDSDFLKSSDLIIYYREKPKNLIQNVAVVGGSAEFSKVDILNSGETFPLLLARLAFVFEIYDKELKNTDEFEDFVEILQGVRVKKEIIAYNTTLEKVAGLLYLINESKKFSVILGKTEDEETMALMSFLSMFKSKVGIFGKKLEYDLKIYEF